MSSFADELLEHAKFISYQRLKPRHLKGDDCDHDN